MPDFNLFRKVPIKVQQKSGFDKSFRNLFTTKCGTLTPMLCDELIPNSDVHLRIAMSAQLPPLASETFMNVNLKTEAFFCPTRLLMVGYEDFLNGKTDFTKDGTTTPSYKLRAPLINIASGNMTDSWIGAGSLSDYLGLRSYLPDSGITYAYNFMVNAFPWLCYHLVYDTWYRNPLIQKSPFDDSSKLNVNGEWTPSAMKYVRPTTINAGTLGSVAGSYFSFLGFQFRDGVHLGDLRQRNFGMDYFTTATQSPQSGNAMGIMQGRYDLGNNQYGVNGFGVGNISSVNSNGVPSFADVVDSQINWSTSEKPDSVQGFTISSLRAANSLQQYLERLNLCGPRLPEYVKAMYGANLKDSIAQRPVYLGSASYPVYTKGVTSTAAPESSATSSVNNPFASVGSRYGNAYAEGNDFVVNLHVDEPGYIMVLTSLVPEVTYSGGVNPMLRRYVEVDSRGDLANAMLQNVGPQPVKLGELAFESYARIQQGQNGTPRNPVNDVVFGFVDRFADWMTRNHELHGLLRDKENLQSFALQRSFDLSNPSATLPTISSNFLQIPTNYLDQVSAVTSDISTYGVWIDSWLDYKVSMPLARYCIPSLQDPAYEHGDTVVVERNGRTID